MTERSIDGYVLFSERETVETPQAPDGKNAPELQTERRRVGEAASAA